MNKLRLAIIGIIGVFFMHFMTTMFTVMAFEFMKFRGLEWLYIIPYLLVQGWAFSFIYREISNRLKE